MSRPSYASYVANNPVVKRDMVNHPSHYISKSGMEVIDVIEAFTQDLTGIEAACTANIIKYACRWKQKNGVEDLKKIIWYANHLVEHVEKHEVDERCEDIRNTNTNEFMYDAPIFENRTDAEEFLNQMKEVLDKYGELNANDLYDMSGFPVTSYEDYKYGWSDLSDAKVVYKTALNAYALSLPRVGFLR